MRRAFKLVKASAIGPSTVPVQCVLMDELDRTASVTIIVAAMHRLAENYAVAKGFSKGTFQTVTEARRLRGLAANTPIIVVDTGVRFQDHGETLRTLRERFTNVRYDHL